MAHLKIEPIKHPDRIIEYWKKEKFAVACIIVFGLSFNSAMIVGPIYQGRLIDAVARQDSLSSILTLAVTFALLIAGIQVMRYMKRFYIRRFANSTSATMRLMIYNNIMHQSAPELSKKSTGDLMTRAISDVELCVEGMRKFTTELFDTGVLMLSYIITLFLYDGPITLWSILFIPLAMFLAQRLKTIIFQYTKEYRKKSSLVTELTYDRIENALLYRISGRETENSNTYQEHLLDLQQKAIKANILENSMQPIYNVIAMFGIVLVIYLGGNKVIDGGWSIGMFSTYVIIFVAMAVKASKASKLFNSVQKSQVSWKRIKPYLTEYEQKDTNSRIQAGHTELIVNGLSFGCGINFRAEEGQIIGITGPIACGKSTLGLALTGLYPYLGSIRIDGKELKEYSEYERSQMISYLGHRPELLSDTIYQNITLGKPEDIGQVLRDVCFEEDLAAMPQGAQTLVGNGGIRLSGGQQSRIALARTLWNKTKLIILDDPFSAVDMKTERSIIQKLRQNYKDSIIILISHRLAIFSEIDQILLMHGDKRVEYGSHKELMESSELYADIYNLQFFEGGAVHE